MKGTRKVNVPLSIDQFQYIRDLVVRELDMNIDFLVNGDFEMVGEVRRNWLVLLTLDDVK